MGQEFIMTIEEDLLIFYW